MSLSLTLIVIAALGTALFDFIYYLPRFKLMEESEERFKDIL